MTIFKCSIVKDGFFEESTRYFSIDKQICLSA